MWGHTRRKQMFENKERAEKQLLTVNSVNPSCSSALSFWQSRPIQPLLQHPFPSRNYMHRLTIHGKLLFLIQRNDVTL